MAGIDVSHSSPFCTRILHNLPGFQGYHRKLLNAIIVSKKGDFVSSSSHAIRGMLERLYKKQSPRHLPPRKYRRY